MNKTPSAIEPGPEQIHSNCRVEMANACEAQREDFEVLVGEVRDSFAHYLGKRPIIASTIVFLAGFYVGWKVKPW